MIKLAYWKFYIYYVMVMFAADIYLLYFFENYSIIFSFLQLSYIPFIINGRMAILK